MLSFQLRNAASDGDIDTVSRIIRENPGIINDKDGVIIRTTLLCSSAVINCFSSILTH